MNSIQPAHVARLGQKRPFGGKDKLTIAQRRGVQYERRVGKLLEKWMKGKEVLDYLDGEWIEYNGKLAQLDKVIVFADRVILFEVKFTWVNALPQLALYTNLLAALGHRAVVRVTVCRNLTPETPRQLLVQTLDDLFDGCVLQCRI